MNLDEFFPMIEARLKEKGGVIANDGFYSVSVAYDQILGYVVYCHERSSMQRSLVSLNLYKEQFVDSILDEVIHD